MYIKLIDSLVEAALGLLSYKLHRTGIYSAIPGFMTHSSFLIAGVFL